MPINPRAPVSGPIDFDSRHGDDFVPPPHLIKQTPLLEADPDLIPDNPVDTSYNRHDILATEPLPKVRPILLGVRKAFADRAIKRSNERLETLARKQQVLRYVGEALLTNRLYTEAEVDGQPNLNRPSTKEEQRAAEKLDKIATKRRRVGAHAHAMSHNLAPPVSATRAEAKHVRRSTKKHSRAQARLDNLESQFRKTVEQPSRQASRVIARRNRAVAKREAIDQAAERRSGKIR